jgi:thiol-disulfide isomerase/thioredoxin
MLRLALLACVFVGCKGKDGPPPDPCAKAKLEGPLAWIADDYPSALACARQHKVPLVIDLWAPWCHTCLSMQSTVFVDPSFAADGKRFVFASLDTDREANAPALAKLSISAWPTFYVIGSADEKVLARFIGGASVAQFHELLDAGARALTGSIAAGDAHLLSAERALAVKDWASADQEATAALEAGPAAWLRRPEVLKDLVVVKNQRKDFAGCVALAESHLDEIGNTANASDFLAYAMGCAKEREHDAPDPVRALRERAVARWQQLVADPAAPLSADDRADAMLNLRDTLDELGRKDEARAVADKQRALLDDAAAKAATPLAAMTYIWPQAEVYVYLGKPLELVPQLEKLAKVLPDEYDPPARLGWIYLKADKLDDAARWTERALPLVYGPRKARLLNQRADIAAKAGDKATERTYREQVVKLWESLPPAQQSADALAKARQALAAAGSAT